jgi:hypothetical protein
MLVTPIALIVRLLLGLNLTSVLCHLHVGPLLTSSLLMEKSIMKMCLFSHQEFANILFTIC